MTSRSLVVALSVLVLGSVARAENFEVHMQSDGPVMHFVPDTISITKGSKVKWINDDVKKQFHTVTSGKVTGAAGHPDKLFASSMIAPGKTFEHTFTEAGTFEYYCMPHVAMKMFGKVIVK